MDQTRFKFLMERYAAGELQEAEWAELSGMVMSGEYDPALHGFIEGIYESAQHTDEWSPEKRQALLDKIYNTETPAGKRGLFWKVAATALVLLASGAVYFYLRPARQVTVAPAPQVIASVADIPPATQKATLTLADGSVVTLDTLGRQELRQGNTAVRQRNGLLQYESRGGEKADSYNTLTTPKGGQYRLVLPDGTAVWLNAGSSLRYPVAFTGKERRVTLTGEAYFEVHHQELPFRIQVGSQVVEDLGTTFNINAYTDEPVIKTTLLEGAVKIGNTLLKPGEQAQVTKEGLISVVKNVNTADAIAWKEGFFVFRNDNLKTVMREISRWYDVEIIYQPNVNNNQQFSGRIDRSLTLAQVLNGLALTKARFTIEENRKVVILP